MTEGAWQPMSGEGGTRGGSPGHLAAARRDG